MVGFPVARLSELANATQAQLATVTVDELGAGLLLGALDVHVSVLGVLSELLGQNFSSGAAGRRGGRVSSEAKAAARANGAKGGRPRKQATTGKRT